MTRSLDLTAGELLGSAQEALRAATNATEAVASPATPDGLTLPLLHEAVENVMTAEAALLALRERAMGIQPPKLGD